MATVYIGEERALPMHLNGVTGGESAAVSHVTKGTCSPLAYVGPEQTLTLLHPQPNIIFHYPLVNGYRSFIQ